MYTPLAGAAGYCGVLNRLPAECAYWPAITSSLAALLGAQSDVALPWQISYYPARAWRLASIFHFQLHFLPRELYPCGALLVLPVESMVPVHGLAIPPPARRGGRT